MKRIVSNTGPLLHLYDAEALDLLPLAGELSIPPAVEAELTTLISTWRDQRPAWLQVQAPVEPYITEALAWQQIGLLDRGEAEAIALARQLDSDWFLTDDAAARLLAQTIRLEVHGSLGVVLWAAATGQLEYFNAKDALQRLAHSSLWLSPAVLAEALAALDQMRS